MLRGEIPDAIPESLIQLLLKRAARDLSLENRWCPLGESDFSAGDTCLRTSARTLSLLIKNRVTRGLADEASQLPESRPLQGTAPCF